MISQTPFIHKFSTDNKKYIYDVNSSHIIESDDIVYDIIDFYSNTKDSKIIEQFGKKYDVKEIEDRINSIHKAQRDGLFSPFHPDKILGCVESINNIQSKLDHEMSMIALEVTQQCNLRCKYCVYSDKYYYTRGYQSRAMSFDTAKKAIDYLLSHSEKSENKWLGISFYGGEPLLNFDLIKTCVEYTNKNRRNRDIIYSMTTNGTLLDDKIVPFLMDNNFSILVSIDGHKQFHNRNRVYKNGKGSFDRIMRNIMWIKEKYPSYYSKSIGFVATLSPPFDSLSDIEQFFTHLLGTEETHSLRVGQPSAINTTYYQQFKDSAVLDQSAVNSFVQRYIDIKVHKRKKVPKFLGHLINESIFERIHNRSQGKLNSQINVGAFCIPGVTRCYVTSDGRYYPCERCNSIGSLNIGDVGLGIDLDKVIDIIAKANALMQEDCSDCWACRLCFMCYGMMEAKDNLSQEQKKKSCNIIRNMYNVYLSNYCKIMEKNPNAFG